MDACVIHDLVAAVTAAVAVVLIVLVVEVALAVMLVVGRSAVRVLRARVYL